METHTLMIALTHEQLTQRQAYPLSLKIQMSLQRIRLWYRHWGGLCYVAFSGGKDSTVLLHLVRSLYPEIPAVYNSFGADFPETVTFVKSIDNVLWLSAPTTYPNVIQKYGYPVVSKEVAQKIERYHKAKDNATRMKLNQGAYRIPYQWFHLLNAPFKISSKCCHALKIAPVLKYEKQTGRAPFTGLMADEGETRKQAAQRTGCNAYDLQRPVSKPLTFWLEQDIWDYIHLYNIPYSPIYDMGYQRTGCYFCGFGLHKEKSPNRFQLMKTTHPALYTHCMDRLGLRAVFSYMGLDIG